MMGDVTVRSGTLEGCLLSVVQDALMGEAHACERLQKAAIACGAEPMIGYFAMFPDMEAAEVAHCEFVVRRAIQNPVARETVARILGFGN